jgi:hypothetical protein
VGGEEVPRRSFYHQNLVVATIQFDDDVHSMRLRIVLEMDGGVWRRRDGGKVGDDGGGVEGS